MTTYRKIPITCSKRGHWEARKRTLDYVIGYSGLLITVVEAKRRDRLILSAQSNMMCSSNINRKKGNGWGVVSA